MTNPGAGQSETLTFDTDIQPLFREKDRNSMRRHFDLWNRDDVRANSEKILGRLQAGTMPCDGRWPAESVAKFRSWVQGGMN